MPGMMDGLVVWVTSNPIPMGIIVVLAVLVVWLYMKGRDSMVSTPGKNIGSIGTSNIVSGGNNPMWAHGSQAAGGHLEQAAGTTGAAHWLHQGPASAASASAASNPWAVSDARTAALRGSAAYAAGIVGLSAMDIDGGPTLAQVMASCSSPSPDAVEDMKMAHMVGSVDPAKV